MRYLAILPLTILAACMQPEFSAETFDTHPMGAVLNCTDDLDLPRKTVGGRDVATVADFDASLDEAIARVRQSHDLTAQRETRLRSCAETRLAARANH